MKISTVAIVGANGIMGAKCAGIISAFGNADIYMIARDTGKAQKGIEEAIKSVRSEVIRKKMKPMTYRDLKTCIPETDWVLEMVSEDYIIKKNVYASIAPFLRPGAIVSTVSSGLSISTLSRSFDTNVRKRFFGTHFYNPPYKMPLCEFIAHSESDASIKDFLTEYLQRILLRQVVVTKDMPAYAGNRIGFQFLNEAAKFAEQYADNGGIHFIDKILGGFTGRAMPPLLTIDFVGIDIHKAIVDNLYAQVKENDSDTFKLPAFLRELVDKKQLGVKTGAGLYAKRVKKNGSVEKLVYSILDKEYTPLLNKPNDFSEKVIKKVELSNYKGALEIIKEHKSLEGQICRHFIARYVSYSFSIIGSVVSDKESVDKVMGYGYNWVPPSALVDLLGGVEETRRFISSNKMDIPVLLQNAKNYDRFYTLQNSLDYRKFIRAR